MTHSFVIRSLLAATAATAACGGSKSSSSSTFAGEAGGAETFAIPFEAAARLDLVAALAQPEALSNREWPAPPITRSVATQRRRFAAAGPDARQAEAAGLATALWYAEASDSDAEQTARAEARKLLREVAEAGGASETVLSMLTVAERVLGDAAASEPIYDQLILRFPQSPRAWHYRAERAWLDLRAGRVQRAGEILDGADLAATHTPAVVHYVAGWLALRRGDPTQAHASLVAAIQRWGDLWTWDTVRNEAFDLAALAGARPDYMRQVVDEIVNGPPKREAGTTNKRIRTVVLNGKRKTITEETTIQYNKPWLLLELGRAYARWGRGAEAVEVFGHALGGDPATDAAVEHASMLLMVASHHPAAVATKAQAAKAALTRAAAGSSAADLEQLQTSFTTDVSRLAAQYAAFAQLSGLPAYRDAAAALAEIAGSAPAPAATAPVYQQAVLDAQLAWSEPLLIACYAAPLQSEARFDGAVTFDVTPGANESAAIASLAPAPGEAGLARVAGCVSRIVANWRLPPAPQASTTTAHVTVAFKPGT